MATRGVVIDRHGNVVDDDDDIVRDGHKLRVPVEFMDAEQRRVFADTRRAEERHEDDVQRQKVLDARQAYCERISLGMHRHRVVTEPGDVADGEEFDRRAVAYDAMKKRLGSPKAKRQRVPAERHGWRV